MSTRRAIEQQFDPAFEEDELQGSGDEPEDKEHHQGLYEDGTTSGEVEDGRVEEEESTSEAADSMVGHGKDPFTNLTQDDIGETGRYLVRAVGPFSHVGDVANAGVSWENECVEWEVRQHAREAQGAPCDERDPDPRDLSQLDNRSVNLTSFLGIHL